MLFENIAANVIFVQSYLLNCTPLAQLLNPPMATDNINKCLGFVLVLDLVNPPNELQCLPWRVSLGTSMFSTLFMHNMQLLLWV